MSESIEGLVERLRGHRAYHLAQAAGQGYSPLSTATGHTELARVLEEAAAVLLSLQGGNGSSSASLPAAPDGATEAQHSAGDVNHWRSLAELRGKLLDQIDVVLPPNGAHVTQRILDLIARVRSAEEEVKRVKFEAR